jgi:hypothetical protein
VLEMSRTHPMIELRNGRVIVTWRRKALYLKIKKARGSQVTTGSR